MLIYFFLSLNSFIVPIQFINTPTLYKREVVNHLSFGNYLLRHCGISGWYCEIKHVDAAAMLANRSKAETVKSNTLTQSFFMQFTSFLF